jgi:two-component system, chemotaxis family, response regulator PixH
MSIKILLVEDSPTQAALSRQELQTIGMDVNVEVVYRYNEALSTIQMKGHNFDLCVLDMLLPDGSGLDLCKQIKTNSITRLVPVIIFSMEGLAKHRQEAYNAGADHYISKGATGSATLKLVASTLLRNKLRKLPRLGEALVAAGYITTAQLQMALIEQEKGGKNLLLGQLLVQKGLITAIQLQEVLDKQKEQTAR